MMKKVKDAGESDGEGDYSLMVSAQNRKHKKSGGWQALGLDSNVFRGIQKKGYRQPTPIQRKTIPLILEGKDVVAMARTGSGKTAAFLVPLFQKLKCRSAKCGARALLMSPTRELALQTFKFVKEIGRYCGMRSAVIVGGDSIEGQFSAVHENPDLLIATPGRLLHLVVEMNLKLDSVQFVVFDEADRLFEMGFLDQLQEILQRLPDSRQTLLFSATLPKMLVDFARAGLNDPTLVRLDVDTKISDQLSRVFLSCRADDKIPTLLFLLRNILTGNENGKSEQTIVFCATKHHVEYLREIIELAGFSVSYLYSNLDPVARKINISKFRNKVTNVLIVTDVAARGVDIPLLDNAVNFHFPAKPKLFVHRVGRVARAGRSGRAFSLVSADEFPYLLDLFLFLGRPLTAHLKTDAEKKGELGSVPQAVVESELDTLAGIMNGNSELETQKKVTENGMKNYLRSRPPASTESVKRTKKDPRLNLATLKANLAPHPIFDKMETFLVAESSQRLEVLEGLKHYKPNLTVFETNTSSKQDQWSVMKDKRRAHQKFIQWKETTESAKIDEDLALAKSLSTEPGTSSEAASNEIQESFSHVIAPIFRSFEGKEKRKKPKRRETAPNESEYFLPNRPTDYHSEQGLAVEKGAFDHAAKEAVLDFTADETSDMRKQSQNKKIWDRKKKKFVGKEEGPRAKKIRTESGVLIPASYKTDRYSKWKVRQTAPDDEADSDDNSAAAKKKRHFELKAGRGQNGNRGGQKRGPGSFGRGGPRSELRSKEQILAERKRKDKLQSYQKFRKEKNQKGKRGQGRKGSGRGKSGKGRR